MYFDVIEQYFWKCVGNVFCTTVGEVKGCCCRWKSVGITVGVDCGVKCGVSGTCM